MIDWNKVEEDILTKLHNSLQEIDPDSAELRMGYGTLLEVGKNIKRYFKSLISKEFKLVAKGKVAYRNDADCGDYFLIDGYGITFKFKKYKGKNISIYISENKEE